MFFPVIKCNNRQVSHDHEGDDVHQLEERTNLIRFGTNAEGIVDD
jgi:hypothetical protein